jgi:hypothetical protein
VFELEMGVWGSWSFALMERSGLTEASSGKFSMRSLPERPGPGNRSSLDLHGGWS